MRRTNRLKQSQLIALMFWSSFAANLVIEVGLELPWAQSSGYAGLTTVLFAGLAFAWVLTHARENDVRVSAALKIAVILIAVIAVPYYKFRYFGAKSGMLFIGMLVLGLAVAVLVGAAITALVSPDGSLL